MKTFLAFAGSLVTVLVLLALVPIPIAERLGALHEDGLRLVEVIERIVSDPRPIDVAFIGTSHTMNAIDDRGIEETLEGTGPRVRVANLGVQWMGRDLHLYLIKELIAKKSPNLIVLEINEHEPPYGHPLMPYVASTGDMFCCEFWTDWNFPKMLLLFLKEQLRGTSSMAWPFGSIHRIPPVVWQYGWVPEDRIWQPEFPHHGSLGDELENLAGSKVRKFANTLVSSFGDHTVEQIASLVRSNHTKIMFLYLPEYIYAAHPDTDNIRFYSDLGPVLLPPQDVVANRLNWHDFAHLNRAGSLELTPAISSAIADYLPKKGSS